MAQRCEYTGKGPQTGHKVSHSNIKTNRRWIPNLKKRKFFIPELKRAVTVRVSTEAISSIDKKGGFSQALLKAKEESLSPRLQKLRLQLRKAYKG